MTSLCLSFLSVEWAGGVAILCCMITDGVRCECTEPSRCLAHSRCSVKWHHWLIHAQGPHWYLYVLIGVTVAFILLLGLLVLLLVRHRCQGKGRKPGEKGWW